MAFRTSFFLFFFILFSYCSYGQSLPPVDVETGRFTYYEVVELPGMDSTTLFGNLAAFAKKVKVKGKRSSAYKTSPAEGNISSKGSFLVYKKASLGKHVDGAIEYSLAVDVQEGRYRYTITDFIYQEYMRNRFGKFQPVTGKYRALEQEVSSLNKGQWEAHREAVDEYMQGLIVNLKNAALGPDEEKEQKKVKRSDNW